MTNKSRPVRPLFLVIRTRNICLFRCLFFCLLKSNKNPNWQQEESWLLQVWPRTNPASGQAGLDPGMAGLRVLGADHEAQLPANFQQALHPSWYQAYQDRSAELKASSLTSDEEFNFSLKAWRL